MKLLGRRKSFETRLSSLVALAVGVTLAVASVAAYLLVAHQLHVQVQKSLVGYEKSLDGQFNAQSAIHYASNSGDRVQLVLPDGQVYVPSPGGGHFDPAPPDAPDLPPTTQVEEMAGGHGPPVSFTDQTLGREHYRVMTVQVPLSGGGTGALQIARPLSDVERALADLRLILALVTAGGIAVALGIGTVVARATIRPVTRLTRAAEHVAATQDLAATIEVDSDDELGRLAQAFNSMLDALRLSREQQAQLVSDAGHELRTPLTSLRTNIELLMRARQMPDPDRAELLSDVRDQIEELTALVGDIVETARADETARVEPTETRLDEVVGSALERARRRAPSLRFEVSLTPGSVRGQPALLERAVLNLLDNAAKWSPPGGTVEVRLSRSRCWLLEVRDHGPGIDEADLPRVFERFYRAPTARSMPGSGLGLAIVRNVVSDHGGTVEAARAPGGGTIVRITLPIVEEDEPATPTDWTDFPPAPPDPAPPDPAGRPAVDREPGWSPAPASSGLHSGVASPGGGIGRRGGLKHL